MAIKLNKAQQIELKSLATFGADGTFWPEAATAAFVKQGVVEVAPNVTNDAGEIAVRISPVGSEFLATLEKGVDKGAEDGNNGDVPNGGSPAPIKTEEAKQKMAFEIENNVAIPKSTGGRLGTSMYPFDKLEVGQSFFVPASEKMPEPAKSLASTVASANARYAVETGKMRMNRKQREVPETRQERQFIVRADEKDGVKGARVFRIEVDAE